MSSETHDFLLLTLHKEEQLLRSQWLRNVTSAEYREGVKVLKNCIVQHEIELWLTDSRLLDTILFADQQWLKREIGPLFKSSSLQRIARVLTEDVFNYIWLENIVQQIKEEHEVTVELAQFSSLEAAFDWLRME
ncbi:hypothetical protein DXT99_03340 [Pontibacter diazotrophicus]|uniref:STAS/SEC14 domain-containing protein n=1 Tax=Pontibacter diazotrophicus TaxID=1400979 RepID=A0A3D8LHK8_9BACT|nr:hypothetical protein DXT99_03340 [Pontibacter diazotrophicus]